LLQCWDGFSMNPSPHFSFAQFELKRITDWVTKYKLDGVFLDFYGDTTDVDESRVYEQFPFYPLQVAEIEFAKAIYTWCKAQSPPKYFVINCPQASMAVQHLADWVTCDSTGIHDHWSMGDRLVSKAFGKRHVLLPQLGPPATSDLWLQNGLRSLFYGEIPAPWQSPAAGADSDAKMIDWMAEATYPLAVMMANAQPLGGDFSALWSCIDNGASNVSNAAFIALNNDGNTVQRMIVALSQYYELPSSQHFEVVLWDGLVQFSTLASGSGNYLSRMPFTVGLKPNETKVLAFVPPGVLKVDELQSDKLRAPPVVI